MCCANCGTKQNEGEKYCPNCGQKFDEFIKVTKEVVKNASKKLTPQEDTFVVSLSSREVVEKNSRELLANLIASLKARKLLERDEVNDENNSKEIGVQNRKKTNVSGYDDILEKIEKKFYLVDFDNSSKTGVISDRISVSKTLLYRSRKEDEYYIETPKKYKFKVYITDNAKIINQIKQVIDKYNNMTRKYGYHSIKIDEKLFFVEGIFIKTKSCVNFIYSFFVTKEQIERELVFERLFKEIYNLCESKKSWL